MLLLTVTYTMVTLPYVLTPWRSRVLKKLASSQLLKKFPAFYRTQRFITAVTNAHHLPLSKANSIQSIPPHPYSIYAWISQVVSFQQDTGYALFPKSLNTWRAHNQWFKPLGGGGVTDSRNVETNKKNWGNLSQSRQTRMDSDIRSCTTIMNFVTRPSHHGA
jgi:hypothetical protein